MKKIFLLSTLFCALYSTAQEAKPSIVYRYIHLPADSANNFLFQHDEENAPNFLLEIRKAVARNQVNVYEDLSDATFKFPVAKDPVEYVIDAKTGQAQKEIKRVSYFETDTEEKKPEPNNQDIYEFVTRPIVAGELKEIRVIETGNWHKRSETYRFTPTFIGFQTHQKNEIGKDLVWINIEELLEVDGVVGSNWMSFFLSQAYEGFQYKQYGYSPTFDKEACIEAKWTVIDRTEFNDILFNDERPSYSMLGQLALYIQQGDVPMETKNPYRYSQGKKDEVNITRRSKDPILDDNGEPYVMVNDLGEKVFAYPFDSELALSTGKLKHIKVYEVDNLAESIHFVFEEEGKNIEYFSVKIKDLMDMGLRITSEKWYEFIRLHKYESRLIRQSNCSDKIMRD